MTFVLLLVLFFLHLFCITQTYYQHLNGRRHKFLRTAYQAKINAMVGLLRSNSQVSKVSVTSIHELLFGWYHALASPIKDDRPSMYVVSWYCIDWIYYVNSLILWSVLIQALSVYGRWQNFREPPKPGCVQLAPSVSSASVMWYFQRYTLQAWNIK